MLEQNLYKFAKPNAFPRSTKVLLGSNEDFNILDNIFEWDLDTLGGIGTYIEKNGLIFNETLRGPLVITWTYKFEGWQSEKHNSYKPLYVPETIERRRLRGHK